MGEGLKAEGWQPELTAEELSGFINGLNAEERMAFREIWLGEIAIRRVFIEVVDTMEGK